MVNISVQQFDAFIFDLDGVVTKTADVHALAWKRLFDELLERRAGGGEWRAFDLEADYRAYVDGKPRREGLRSFLASRNISLSEGKPDDGAETDSIHGLAQRKNRYVLEHLEKAGVEAYKEAIDLIHAVRVRGLMTAVVSASENTKAVLSAAGLKEQFDVMVDGLELLRLGLRGKPAPDTFLEAARRLGSAPSRVAVFEDAIAGVQAGRAGGFGLVIGVARAGHDPGLRGNGADVVVAALDEVVLVTGDSRAGHS